MARLEFETRSTTVISSAEITNSAPKAAHTPAAPGMVAT